MNEDDENDDSCDDSDDEKQYSNGNIQTIDLEERLKGIDNLVTKNITKIDVTRTFGKVYEEVVKGERSKRMVMIVDRRIDGKDRIENEKNYGKYKEEQKE